MKNQEARNLNNSFKNNQGKVFRIFREIIDSDKDCEAPIFKQIEKERKFFVDADPVINFWKALWCKQDQGHPDAEWLSEYKELFEKEIPEVNNGDIVIAEDTAWNAIKKKRNWSSPGPDLVVNFWLKKLSVMHTIINETFKIIINTMSDMVPWFCQGRTSLLEKPGDWVYNNTRPITCTNNMYKWYTTILQKIFNDHTKKHEIMQIDQRGAKEKCSGTQENLLIDNMILKDTREHRRNVACC